MANYITAKEFTEITDVTAEQCGELEDSTAIRDAAIAKAQITVLRDLNITSFSGSETDYSIIQEAIAYLTAHKISLRHLPLTIMSKMTSPFKDEYKDAIRILKTGESDATTSVLPSLGGFDTIDIISE